jgi:DNA topoisomerase III
VPTERGIGLVEGYNTMGYQLNKPFLRSSMELDCQRITRGELRKEDMIRNCLEQMKVESIYNKASHNAIQIF